ncbi:hypothetical protein Droror1_Dr00023794 [Drosera rotundifolia]
MVTLKQDVGTLGELTFTDNSSWISSTKFRLSVRVTSDFCEGVCIREAKTKAFGVKDHRGECRIYLGMHSLIDIIGGLVMGLGILVFWIAVSEYIDNFIVSEQNVTYFWAALSLLLSFAYPTPELPTPSFEFHTSFKGVAFGIVAGIQQSYHQFHHEDVPHLFTSKHNFPSFLGRVLVGIPTILLVKFCTKALAKWVLPVAMNATGIPIRSSSYLSAINKRTGEPKQSGYLQKLFFFAREDSFDIDTAIRFIQYAGLAWAVVDLVPALFSALNL